MLKLVLLCPPEPNRFCQAISTAQCILLLNYVQSLDRTSGYTFLTHSASNSFSLKLLTVFTLVATTKPGT